MLTLVKILASPERDVAPSTVSLRVFMDWVPEVELIAWDYEGDGRFDAEGPHLHSQTVIFSSAGHFSPRVNVTNSQGQTFEATADVVLENPEDLQADRNARRGMLAALAEQDLEGAVAFVVTRKRDAMRHDWTMLADHLGEITNLFTFPFN